MLRFFQAGHSFFLTFMMLCAFQAGLLFLLSFVKFSNFSTSSEHQVSIDAAFVLCARCSPFLMGVYHASVCEIVFLSRGVLLGCRFVASLLLCFVLRDCPLHGKDGAVAAHLPARCDRAGNFHKSFLDAAARESWLGG